MNFTKQAITESFLQLLDEKPFSKITVKNIVERCGINRNTFYYHYQDIPALLEEILISRIDALVEKHCQIGSLEDCIAITVQYFTENKKSVMHVYRSLPREIFIQHLNHLLMYLVREYITNISSALSIAPEDKEIIVRYFKCLLVGIFLDWLDSGMSYDLLGDSLRVCRLQAETGLQFLINTHADCAKGPDAEKECAVSCAKA